MKKVKLINKLKFVDYLVILFISLMVSLALIIPGLRDIVAREELQTFYGSEDLYDFIIPSPSASQIAEMKKLDFIDDIVPYYETFVVYGNEKIKLIIADSVEDKFGSFIVADSAVEPNGNAYVNDIFSNIKNVGPGNSLQITFNGIPINIVVKCVYKGDFDGIPTVGMHISDIDNKLIEQLPYSGAYVYTNDNIKAAAFLLDSYKPLGKLGAKDSYATDEQYELHKNAIINSDYSLEIGVTNNKALNRLSELPSYGTSYSKLVIGVIISIAFVLVLTNVKISSSDIVEKIYRMKRMGVTHKQLQKIFNGFNFKISFIFLLLVLCCSFIYSIFNTNILNILYYLLILVILIFDFLIGLILNKKRVSKIMREYEELKRKEEELRKDTSDERSTYKK